MKKVYFGAILDHSGSMASGGKTHAAKSDFNQLIDGMQKDTAAYDVATLVSVLGCGVLMNTSGGYHARDYGNEFRIVLTPPNGIKPMTSYEASGNTPLYDAIAMMIKHFESMPDNKDAQILIEVLSDGEENGSRNYHESTIRQLIKEKDALDNWTFVARTNNPQYFTYIGFHNDNIKVWDGASGRSLENTTLESTAARSTYLSAVATGTMRKTTSFYTDLSKVSVADVQGTMTDISKDVRVFQLTTPDVIKPFVEKMTGAYVKGTAFYQLTKPEDVVQDYKILLVLDKKSGAVYSGRDARSLLSLPTAGNCKIIPGNHGNFEVYIQSTSINRKLPGGSKLIVWDPMSAVNNKTVVATKPQSVAPQVLSSVAAGIHLSPTQKTVISVPATAKRVRNWVSPTNVPDALSRGYKDGLGRQRNRAVDVPYPYRADYIKGFESGKAKRKA